MGFKEGHHGQLAPGLAADIVILNGDIEASDASNIGELGIAVTICDGEVTFDNGQL
jgi:predicted amidohydrolase YtcJ